MKSLIVSPPTTVQGEADVYALVDRWLAWLDVRVASGELSKQTRTTYANGVGRFIDWCRDNRVSSVSNAEIMSWLADLRQKHKTGTANTWLAGLRAFCSWAVGAGHLPHNPCEGVKGASRRGAWSRHKRDALTNSEMARLLKSFSDTLEGKRNRAIVFLMAYTALRTVEIHRANVENFKTVSGKLVLEVHGKGKAEADDLVVLEKSEVLDVIHEWLAELGKQTGPLFISMSDRSRGERLSLGAIRWIVKEAYKACGIFGRGKTTHSLRHSAITNVIRNGAPVQKAQAMARHADISTTMIYFHETDRVEAPAEAFVSYEPDA